MGSMLDGTPGSRLSEQLFVLQVRLEKNAHLGKLIYVRLKSAGSERAC